MDVSLKKTYTALIPTMMAPMGSRSKWMMIVSWMSSIKSNIGRTPAKFTASSWHKYSYKKVNVWKKNFWECLIHQKYWSRDHFDDPAKGPEPGLTCVWESNCIRKEEIWQLHRLNRDQRELQKKLTESSSNGDDRGNMEIVKAVPFFIDHSEQRPHDNDKVNRTHPVPFL